MEEWDEWVKSRWPKPLSTFLFLLGFREPYENADHEDLRKELED